MKDTSSKFFNKIMLKIMSIIMIIYLILSFITKDITPFIASLTSLAIIFIIKWSMDKKYKYIKEKE